MASVSRSYRAVFERDESGAWIARVPSVRGCHTYGRTLDQARRRLREALALWVDEPYAVELVEDVRLPPDVKAAVRASRADRRRAEEHRAEARASTTRAARALVDDLGVGFRDAAELLGVSHQRVQQLVRG
jgi:predicted RNase H-like HicB family nuclease